MARSSRAIRAVIASIANSRGFVSDAADLAEVAQIDFEVVVERLRQADGFLGPAGIHRCAEHLPETQRDAIVSVVLNLVGLRRELECTVDEFATALEERLSHPSCFERFEHSTSRILALAAAFPAVERQAKAEALSDLLGAGVKSARVVCDLRPVFNEERDEVEGFIPVSTLRLVFRRSEPFEATLTPLQVKQLHEELSCAMRKIEKLKTTMQGYGALVPELEADDE